MEYIASSIRNLVGDFQAYMEAGGWVMPPLVLLLLVLWYALGYRAAVLHRGSQRGARRLIDKVRQGRRFKRDGVLVRAAQKGVEIQQTAPPNLRRWLDDAFWQEERDIRRFNVLIGTIVAVAPLLGLLGTVIGMIETFDSLGDMSLYAQSGGIAGGISQALFTTQMGLAVSIPGLIINGIFARKQKDLQLELAQIKDILCSEPAAPAGA